MADHSGHGGGSSPRIVATAVAKFDFAARKETELSFHKGDVIKITVMSGGWWLGILASATGQKEAHKFPSNYVAVDPENMRKESAVVVNKFDRRNHNELSVPARANVIVINYEAKSTWSTAEYMGHRGLVPTSYLKTVHDGDVTDIPPPDIPPPPLTPPSSGDGSKTIRASSGLMVNPPRGMEKANSCDSISAKGPATPPADSSPKPPPCPSEGDSPHVSPSVSIQISPTISPRVAEKSFEAPVHSKSDFLAPSARVRSQSASVKRGPPPPNVAKLRAAYYGNSSSTTSSNTSPGSASPGSVSPESKMKVPQLKVCSISTSPGTVGTGDANSGATRPATTHRMHHREGSGSDHAMSGLHTYRRNRYSWIRS